jgi:vitamin B12 transporter
MSKTRFFALLFLVGPVLSVRAAESADSPVVAPELVVTGKRLRGDHHSARVYTEGELARESGRSIGEILREEAGVDYLAGTGGNSNLLIRGSSGSETLVLIDGVKANDPSATNRYFDWSRIDAAEIERVEILKGPQAVSYGSDAIGGVVLITTKHGGARPGARASTASIEAGSRSFVRARGSLATALGSVAGGDHELSLHALGKGVFNGESSALSANGIPAEGDDSREASAGIALRSRWGRDTRSSVVADLRAAREEIDGGAYDDDPNSVARNREIRAAATVDGKFPGGNEWGIVASHLDFRRAYSVPSDVVLNGANSRAEAHLHSGADSLVEWTGGFEATRESLHLDSLLSPAGLTRDQDETYALFAESSVPLDSSRRLAIDFGSRFSHFTSYGNQWSEQGGLNVRPSDALEFDAGVSTGFKAPSLYSLYEPESGNAGLKPEESVQAEAGVTVHPDRAWLVSVRGFATRTRNRFGYDPNPPYRSLNVARATVQGIEFGSEGRIARGLRVAPSLTYLSTRDEATGLALSDVPKWKGALKIAYDLSRAHSFTLSLLAKSSRGTSAGNARVAGFYRVDFTTRHRLSRGFTLTTRFENVLDRDYQEVRGYQTPGLSAYLGLEFASL